MIDWNDDWKKALSKVKDDSEMRRIKDFLFLEYIYGTEVRKKLKDSGIGITVAFKSGDKWGTPLTIDEAYNKARRGFKYDRIDFTKHSLEKRFPDNPNISVSRKEVIIKDLATMEVDILHMDVRVVRVRMFDKMRKLIKTLFSIRIMML